MVQSLLSVKQGKEKRMPRTPETLIVNDLWTIRTRLHKAWERAEKTGVATAKVDATRYGAAGTTFGSLLQELNEKLDWVTECAEYLDAEAGGA
jgi:hypothetical protein